jgi:hypothetical protein
MGSYDWEKIVISEPLLSPTLKNHYLRQLKNSQNQTNKTGGQNFKECNNTAGWLSVFFVMNLSSRVNFKPPLHLPNRPENIQKENCSNLVIWPSTMSNIRIQKFFVIGN